MGDFTAPAWDVDASAHLLSKNFVGHRKQGESHQNTKKKGRKDRQKKINNGGEISSVKKGVSNVIRPGPKVNAKTNKIVQSDGSSRKRFLAKTRNGDVRTPKKNKGKWKENVGSDVSNNIHKKSLEIHGRMKNKKEPSKQMHLKPNRKIFSNSNGNVQQRPGKKKIKGTVKDGKVIKYGAGNKFINMEGKKSSFNNQNVSNKSVVAKNDWQRAKKVRSQGAFGAKGIDKESKKRKRDSSHFKQSDEESAQLFKKRKVDKDNSPRNASQNRTKRARLSKADRTQTLNSENITAKDVRKDKMKHVREADDALGGKKKKPKLMIDNSADEEYGPTVSQKVKSDLKGKSSQFSNDTQFPAVYKISKTKLLSLPLRERMLVQLKSSRFRYVNEQLYTSQSKDAENMFKKDPNLFRVYHEGFKQQVEQWPLNPIEKIIKSIKRKPANFVVADFGCGEALLAKSLPNTVHSFDLVALSDEVTVCDMAHTPLESNSVDICVFCLALMGTNLGSYIVEANRVLKLGGALKIAEVASRFDNVEHFIKYLKKYGFSIANRDISHDLFYFLNFTKDGNVKNKVKDLPSLSLKPCWYKKR